MIEFVALATRLYILFLVGSLIAYYWRHKAERYYVIWYVAGSLMYMSFVIYRITNQSPETLWNLLGALGSAVMYHIMARHNIQLYGRARGARAVARAVNLYDTHGRNGND